MEQIAGGAPIFLTGQGQLVEVARLPAVWENERVSEGPDDGRAVSRRSAQLDAVEVTVDGVGRVGARTLIARLDHRCHPWPQAAKM
jgi:hypothetical protein